MGFGPYLLNTTCLMLREEPLWPFRKDKTNRTSHLFNNVDIYVLPWTSENFTPKYCNHDVGKDALSPSWHSCKSRSCWWHGVRIKTWGRNAEPHLTVSRLQVTLENISCWSSWAESSMSASSPRKQAFPHLNLNICCLKRWWLFNKKSNLAPWPRQGF